MPFVAAPPVFTLIARRNASHEAWWYALPRRRNLASAFKQGVREHPLRFFFPLAFLLSWYPTLLSFVGVRASGINPLGVLAAALIVSGLAGGRPGVTVLLRRMIRVRVGLRWYAVALLLPACFAFLSLGLTLIFGARLPAHEQWANWPGIVDHFLIMFLFVGLGEEPGWRGFALPELQKSRSGLESAMLVGVAWALWHIPLMGTEFRWNNVPAFLLSVFAGSVVAAWLFNSAKESVLLCMLFHASVNAVTSGYVFPLFGDADLTRLWWIYALVWVAGAAAIAWRSGPALRSGARS